MNSGFGTGMGAPQSPGDGAGARSGAAPSPGAAWQELLTAEGLAEGDVAGVTRAMRNGEPVVLKTELAWPLPPLPLPAAGTEGAHSIRLTDRAVSPAEREVVLRPPSLVVGVGASRGVSAHEVLGLVEEALWDAGLSARSLAWLATVDAKADEPGILAAAEWLGVSLVTYGAEELATVDVPNPSGASLTTVGTPSVAEAAALVRGGELLVPKRRSSAQPAMATCAVVRRAAVPVGLDPAGSPLSGESIR